MTTAKADALYSSLPAYNGNHYLEVSRSGNGNGLDAPAVYLKVYFKSSAGGTVVLYDSDHCPTAPDTNTPAPTRYLLYPATSNESFPGVFTPHTAVSAGVNQSKSNIFGTMMCGVRTVSRGGLTRSTLHPGYFVAVLLVVHDGPVGGGGINAFKASAINSDGTEAKVGFYNDNSVTQNSGDPGMSYSFFALQDRLSATNTYSNFTFDFAPPCDYGVRNGYLKWRDDDWGGLQTNNNFRTVLREYDRASGVLLGTRIIAPRGGNGAFQQAVHSFRGDRKYTWTWENVIKTNGIQIYMPFSSMGASQSCVQKGDVQANCTAGFRGFAFDDDRFDVPLNVMIRIFRNGDQSVPGHDINLLANNPIPEPPFSRSALALFNIVNKGFTHPIPDSFKDGGTHTFVVIAFNAPGTPGTAFFPISVGSFSCGDGSNQLFNLTPNIVRGANDKSVSFKVVNNGNGESRLSDSSGSIIDRQINIIRPDGTVVSGVYSVSDRQIISGGGGVWTEDWTIPSIYDQPGNSICPYISVKPVTGVTGVANFTPADASYSTGGAQERHAGSLTDGCITLSTKPYLKFFGGEVVTGAARAELDESSVPATIDCQETGGGHISAWARNNGSGRYQGASSQLTVSGLLSINQFYSASNKTTGLMAPKSLTFANEGSPEADSEYGGDSQNQPCIPDYFEQSKDPAIYSSGISWNGSSGLPADDGRLQLDLIGNTIAATTVPRGTQVAIFADGDVTITGNITYQTGATAWEDHPYFVLIVNGDINIDRNVTRLDGLYIAQTDSRDGTIRTCTEGSSLVTKGSIYASCLNQLSINGGLIADRVKYLRTFGSLGEATDPDEWPNFDSGSGTGAAEVINYTPEMFLAPSPLARPARPGSETNTANRGVYDAIKSMPPAY